MSSDDPFGQDGGDWGDEPRPPSDDDNIDMNYGQPLPPQSDQPPSRPPQPGQGPQPGQVPQPGLQPGQAMQPSPGGEVQSKKGKLENEDIIAMALTFFLPGVGHMMLGQVKKGIAIFAATYLTCGAGYFLTILFAVDAYLVAMTKKYRAVDDWEILPDSKEHLGIG